MNKAFLVLFIFSCTFFISCKKESQDSGALRERQQQNSKSFLKDIKSDAVTEYFISGEFEGHSIYLGSTHSDYFPSNDTIMNAIYLNKTIGLDNIHLVRENQDRAARIAIYFQQSKIFSRQFPYVFPYPNVSICEDIQIELINMKKLGTTSQGAPEDDYSFWGSTNGTLKVQVNRFIDNILEGAFEGTLSTKTGATIIAKNGKFRIRVKLVKTGGE